VRAGFHGASVLSVLFSAWPRSQGNVPDVPRKCESEERHILEIERRRVPVEAELTAARPDLDHQLRISLPGEMLKAQIDFFGDFRESHCFDFAKQLEQTLKPN